MGGQTFVTYCFFDFIMIFVIIVITMIQGAEANDIDVEFKEYLMKVLKNIDDTR